jgi:hypothetical protein
MAYDSARDVTVVFASEEGGWDDTWELHGTIWTRVEPLASPPGEGENIMVYDSARRVVVMLGGVNVDEWWAADTWEYDGTTWIEVLPQVAPAARAGGALVYDSARGVSVLFGGTTPFDLHSTWEYDGDRWTGVVLEASPFAGTTHAMAYDSGRGVVVLLGADGTWEYDALGWTAVPDWGVDGPPHRLQHGMAYDATRDVVVLYGGYLTGGSDAADTWEYRPPTWSSVIPRVSPPGMMGHAMAYDSARRVVVAFGGSAIGSSDLLADTWEYDGTSWTDVATPASPSPRSRHTMVYDERRGAIVLFGGYTFPPDTTLGDTWEYDGASWTEIESPVAPSARWSSAMTYDSVRGVVVLFGGSGSETMMGDTWEYVGP